MVITNVDNRVIGDIENTQCMSVQWVTEVTMSSHQAMIVKLLIQFTTNTAAMTDRPTGISVIQTALSAILDITAMNLSVVVTRVISRLSVVVHSVGIVDLVTKDITISGTEALHITVPDTASIVVIVN